MCALLATVTGPHPELLAWLLLTPSGMLLALVDASVHRLPDALTLPLAGAALALLAAASMLPGARGSWTTALLGAAALGSVSRISGHEWGVGARLAVWVVGI
ncbi:hypothetical protein [Streptomyces sp. NBC_01361]|uniref:hypothetical protein n=1 Tax=Streptomyces sp. NBC_01361 TaxID=2903838 RepID=UPI002E349EF0|nr:hypothetical protein [Streptomyces sp. NBC_01361]